MKLLRKKIDQIPYQTWNIVSVVRDPVARNIAAFFESIDIYLPEWKDLWEHNSLPISKLMECFFENEEKDAFFWFEKKLEPVFGIDVYASPFPHSKGYKIYNNLPRARLLLIRLENLNQVATAAISKFIGFKNFTLLNTNIGNQKPYAGLYHAVLQAPMPTTFVDKCYSSRLAQHFYSEEELNTFKEKWIKKRYKQ